MPKSDKKNKTTAEDEVEDVEMAEPEVESVCNLLSRFVHEIQTLNPSLPKNRKKTNPRMIFGPQLKTCLQLRIR